MGISEFAAMAVLAGVVAGVGKDELDVRCGWIKPGPHEAVSSVSLPAKGVSVLDDAVHAEFRFPSREIGDVLGRESKRRHSRLMQRATGRDVGGALLGEPPNGLQVSLVPATAQGNRAIVNDIIGWRLTAILDDHMASGNVWSRGETATAIKQAGTVREDIRAQLSPSGLSGQLNLNAAENKQQQGQHGDRVAEQSPHKPPEVLSEAQIVAAWLLVAALGLIAGAWRLATRWPWLGGVCYCLGSLLLFLGVIGLSDP